MTNAVDTIDKLPGYTKIGGIVDSEEGYRRLLQEKSKFTIGSRSVGKVGLGVAIGIEL